MITFAYFTYTYEQIYIIYIRSHHVQTLRIQFFIAVVLTEKGMLKESEQILRFFCTVLCTVLINGFTFLIKISIDMITSNEKIFFGAK